MNDEARKAMEHALVPRNLDGRIEPMQFFDELPKPKLYPHFRKQVGGNRAMVFADEFADGHVPDDLEYLPGHERPGGNFFNGSNFDVIVYDDPHCNLPPHEQELLQKALSAEQQVPPVIAKAVPGMDRKTSDAMLDPLINTPSGLVHCSATGAEPISNFGLQVIEKRTIIEHNKPDFSELLLSITCFGRSHSLIVPMDDLGDVLKAIQQGVPECTISSSAKQAKLLISNFVRHHSAKCPRKTIVKSTGFTPVNGHWVYVHDAAVSPADNFAFETGKRISSDPHIGPCDAFRLAIGVLDISRRLELMLPLLLLVHLGPLFEFFHQAGYPPRFVVFLSGTTGSMKTSLALCLFHLFDGDGEKPEANFQDTEAALEMKLGGAHSRVLLVDDFCPAVTTASGKLKLARLELIIRFIGDQISKSRSTPTLKRAKEFAPAGCCIVTGESTGGTRSTLLRCLLLAIDRKDIDGNKLRIYQENPLLLQTHMVHFLHWCGYNGDSIIDFLKKEFLNERQSFMTVVAERRVVDCGATLMLVARLFLEYALSIGALESNDVEILAPLWRQVIEAALRSSEAATKELNPLSMYLSAVFNLRRSGRLPLASSSDAYSPEKHLGFLDGDLWWVRSDDLFKCVLQYWRGSGQIFPLRDGDIKKLLAANELIEVDHEVCNGRSKTLYMRKTSLDGRPRMLVLRSDSAQEYLERELKNFEL